MYVISTSMIAAPWCRGRGGRGGGGGARVPKPPPPGSAYICDS